MAKRTSIQADTKNWERLAKATGHLQTRGSGAGRAPSVSLIIDALNTAMDDKDFFNHMKQTCLAWLREREGEL